VFFHDCFQFTIGFTVYNYILFEAINSADAVYYHTSNAAGDSQVVQNMQNAVFHIGHYL
jgi:hypothetical protein